MLTLFIFFFFNDTATTEIYTLSLHDALPISGASANSTTWQRTTGAATIHVSKVKILRRISQLPIACRSWRDRQLDRKSTRLNSSHSQISYAVFCLKKKKTSKTNREPTLTPQS